MLDVMSSCSVVVSSSLHGIVVAESLGIPAWWLSGEGLRSKATQVRLGALTSEWVERLGR